MLGGLQNGALAAALLPRPLECVPHHGLAQPPPPVLRQCGDVINTHNSRCGNSSSRSDGLAVQVSHVAHELAVFPQPPLKEYLAKPGDRHVETRTAYVAECQPRGLVGYAPHLDIRKL